MASDVGIWHRVGWIHVCVRTYCARSRTLIVPRSFDLFKQTARQLTGKQVLQPWEVATCAWLGGTPHTYAIVT